MVKKVSETEHKRWEWIMFIGVWILAAGVFVVLHSPSYWPLLVIILGVFLYILLRRRRMLQQYLHGRQWQRIHDTTYQQCAQALGTLLSKADFHDSVTTFFRHPDADAYSEFIARIDTVYANQHYTITACIGMLPKSLPGWLLLVRKGSKFFSRGDTQLESVEFDKETYLAASSRSLAFAVLAPDFMAWYLDQPDRPWLYVEGTTFIVAIPEIVQEKNYEQLLHRFDTVAEFLLESGALETLLPRREKT